MKNGVKNIKAAAYNGTRTIDIASRILQTEIYQLCNETVEIAKVKKDTVIYRNQNKHSESHVKAFFLLSGKNYFHDSMYKLLPHLSKYLLTAFVYSQKNNLHLN